MRIAIEAYLDGGMHDGCRVTVEPPDGDPPIEIALGRSRYRRRTAFTGEQYTTTDGAWVYVFVPDVETTTVGGTSGTKPPPAPPPDFG